ncbi:hypothetical protein H5410_051332, partial [Solanum commersonii]
MGLVEGFRINGLPGIGDGNDSYPWANILTHLALLLLPAKALLRTYWIILTSLLLTMLGFMPLSLFPNLKMIYVSILWKYYFY